MANWTYDPEDHTYSSGSKSLDLAGTDLPEAMLLLIARTSARVEAITERLLAGQTPVATWEADLRDTLDRAHLAAYAAGRGGFAQMTDADREALSGAVVEQYGFLRGFAEEIGAGALTAAMIASRVKLYAGAIYASGERGRAAAWSLRLPAYPGDGSTQCRVNCRCRWEFAVEEDRPVAYWRTSLVESCQDCIGRSGAWAPWTG